MVRAYPSPACTAPDSLNKQTNRPLLAQHHTVLYTALQSPRSATLQR